MALPKFPQTKPEYTQRLSDLKSQLSLENDNDRQAYINGKEMYKNMNQRETI